MGRGCTAAILFTVTCIESIHAMHPPSLRGKVKMNNKNLNPFTIRRMDKQFSTKSIKSPNTFFLTSFQ
ncbi:hypothetical protein ERO13_D08G068650v2 [Gossypium hirsutum]|uniref:Secreted protein n=1 Tax=Gossypium darwinii TaxID=34276 RepID=A0A5D2BJ47_GOSDA|nr:hypothetical protein ERO13_D08G068650v2 [Gossypium hirsutum]TYG56588.1 hypothetical protein ES288_D08G075500v1 [Gossypium darwinii]